MHKRRGLYHSLHRSYKEKNWKRDNANRSHRSKPSRSTNHSKCADSGTFKPLIRKRVNRIYKKNRSRKLKADSAAMRRLRQQQELKQLPILASIELIREKTEESLFSTATSYEAAKSKRSNQSEKLLFKDYVLIPSRTKFKHLVYTVLDHIQLANKSDYSVIDGTLLLIREYLLYLI